MMRKKRDLVAGVISERTIERKRHSLRIPLLHPVDLHVVKTLRLSCLVADYSAGRNDSPVSTILMVIRRVAYLTGYFDLAAVSEPIN